jgi:hypothetical protein
MQTYEVVVTETYEVEADSEDEAKELVKEHTAVPVDEAQVEVNEKVVPS